MAIAFNCPHCGELHRVKDELAGRTGKCKSAKCKQPILIPFRSTVSVNGTGTPPPVAALSADELAAAALAEETQPKKDEAPVDKIQVECPGCSAKFEVDAAMAGKNVRCPECGKIFRAPLPKADKPLDWRKANEGRPSLAKDNVPVPEGAWDVQRRGVAGVSIRLAGAHEIEDEDDIRERKFRNIKRAIYGLAILGLITFAVLMFIRMGKSRKEEKWMEQAVAEIEDKGEGSNRPEYQAAIHRFALEYFVHAAKQREDLDAAAKHFDKALSGLQTPTNPVGEREGMLVELGLALVACSGDQKEIDEDRRLPWERLQKMMRQTLEKIPATTHSQRILRQRAFRLLAHKLAEKEQPLLALAVANGACGADEKGNIEGRIGIEYFLMGKREWAQQVLSKAKEPKPELTALWLALNPDGAQPPQSIAVPPIGKTAVSRDSRLAYAEGTALRGNLAQAIAYATMPGAAQDRVDALILIAAVGIETGKSDEAGQALDYAIAALQSELKDAKAGLSSWQMHRIVELCARINKMDKAQTILDAIPDPSIRAWARLEMFRLKLPGQAKQKIDEQGLEGQANPPGNTPLATAIGLAEVARHNAALGESNYAKSIASWAKGTIRPFGYAGTALGQQDRHPK